MPTVFTHEFSFERDNDYNPYEFLTRPIHHVSSVLGVFMHSEPPHKFHFFTPFERHTCDYSKALPLRLQIVGLPPQIYSLPRSYSVSNLIPGLEYNSTDLKTLLSCLVVAVIKTSGLI